MSDIEIYIIAKVAREKLLWEYGFKDHNLHRLVAHANLYDNLLDAYYKQEEQTEEKGRTDSGSSSTRRATFNIPCRPRQPRVRGDDEDEQESKERRMKASNVPEIEVEFCEAKMLSGCDNRQESEGSTEVTVVEMMLGNDG
jgi:hypothetical protein